MLKCGAPCNREFNIFVRMKQIKLQGHTLKLYDSIDEIPVVNFQKYNKCILIDSGIGSDIDAVDNHIVNVMKFVKADDKAKVLQELQNMRQNMHMIVSNVSPKHMAFAALIHSIDGEEQKDLSDDRLQELVSMFGATPRSLIIDILEKVKKNFRRS